MFKAFSSAAVALSILTYASAALASPGGGSDGFGKTNDFDSGFVTENTYTQGFFCDTTVPAQSQSGCEVGKTFNKPPSKNFDPLWITVPLGFTVPQMDMQCPNGLTCVDHPATIDLSAIGGPANAATPGHDHFTSTRNGGVPEWWDVYVVGVTDRATYYAIRQHGSFAYVEQLIKSGDKHVTKPIPTNLFLFFAVGR